MPRTMSMNVLSQRLLAGALWLILALPLAAQERSWVQMAARPDPGSAARLAAGFGADLGQPVQAFRLASGWVAVVAGPQPVPASEALLRRWAGRIPADSFVTDGGRFRGEVALAGPDAAEGAPPGVAAPIDSATLAPTSPEAPERAPVPGDMPAGEDLARLQAALAWAGVYRGAVDGVPGPGTRQAMAAWQRREGVPVTGLLAEVERDALFAAQAREERALGMARVTRPEAGIAIDLPMALLEPAQAEPPFVRFAARDGAGPEVLLISQSGDAVRLAALYEVMQTLDDVPLEGARALRRDGFTLTGERDDLLSVTEVLLQGGAIKGFMLVWPLTEAQPADRMERVLDRMRGSFTPIPGAVLPDAGSEGPAPPSLAGLQPRNPSQAGSGVYVTETGLVATAHALVASCAGIDNGAETAFSVAATDVDAGIALLRPETPIRPVRRPALAEGPPPAGAEIAVSGYSYNGALGAPSLTFGSGAAPVILAGSGGLPAPRIEIEALAGDVGGPVLDDAGRLAGLLLPLPQSGERRLPPNVRTIASPAAVARLLEEAGATIEATSGDDALPPETLAAHATDFTVLISCWN